MNYSAAQLATYLGISKRCINYRATKEAWPFTERLGRGGGRLFKQEDLPSYIRLAIAARECPVTPSPSKDGGVMRLNDAEFNQRVVAVAEALNLVPIGQAEAILKEASAVVKDSALVDASGDRFNAIKREYLGPAS